MNEKISVAKDDNCQQLVPTEWRETLSAIVTSFVKRDYGIRSGVERVGPVSDKTALRVEKNIRGYGGTLVELQNDAWMTSVCQWMQGYWDVVVDLSTQEEGRSDLALFVRVFEEGCGYRFDILSVHVP